MRSSDCIGSAAADHRIVVWSSAGVVAKLGGWSVDYLASSAWPKPGRDRANSNRAGQ